MASTYLTTSYKDRDQVKALGARWDPDEKRWYVPSGRDLAPFDRWLPTELRLAVVKTQPTGVITMEAVASTKLTPTDKGVPLSQLLAGVAQAVAQAYQTGVWTTAEVL